MTEEQHSGLELLPSIHAQASTSTSETRNAAVALRNQESSSVTEQHQAVGGTESLLRLESTDIQPDVPPSPPEPAAPAVRRLALPGLVLDVLAGAFGGGVGSLLRVLTTLAQSQPSGCSGSNGTAAAASFSCLAPWPTFTVNLIGCFLLGLIAKLSTRHKWTGVWKALLGGGFCGGFTTFSSVAVETVRLGDAGYVGFAFLYIILTTVCGIACAVLGYYLPIWTGKAGRWVNQRRAHG